KKKKKTKKKHKKQKQKKRQEEKLGGGLFWKEGFFFQAEDGIRGAGLSRGLGDVYNSKLHASIWTYSHPEV
ncbi:hypothetical protein, partial [Klebsiella pneumoniae]|uniref:hypothetical protein n=1 Tax=Klebsiella pneumoniae TaxID=573 RepID=UPI003F8CC693